MLARAAGLRPGARAVVEAAAVVRIAAGEDLLAHAAGLPRVRGTRALSDVMSSGVLREVEQGRFAFRHDLARQAVYEAIPGPRRRTLHLRIAKKLESSSNPSLALLAHHFARADRPEDAGRYAEAAADEAHSLGDDGTAVRILQDVLALRRLPADLRGELASKLGRAALHGLGHAEAIPILEAVLENDPLPAGSRGELRFRLARLLLRTNERARGLRQMEAAIPYLDERPELAIRAMATLSLLPTFERDVKTSLRWSARACRTADRFGDPLVSFVAHADRATALLAAGDPRGWDAAREALARVGKTDLEEGRERARALRNFAEAAMYLGHYRRAAELLDEAREVCTRVDCGGWVMDRRKIPLLLRYFTGEWKDLEEDALALLASVAPPAAGGLSPLR